MVFRTLHARSLLLTLLALSLMHPAAAGGEDTRSATYEVPSSVVVTGVFGVGKLLCADPDTAALGGVVPNGACFDYGAGDVGRPFRLVADDAVWDNASLSVAVDVNGDGCVSSSCSGEPNPADDYLVAGCGDIEGVLPAVEPGVAHVLQVFVRAVELDPEGGACGATRGTVTLHLS